MQRANTGAIILAFEPVQQFWRGIRLAFSGKNGKAGHTLKHFYPTMKAAHALIDAGSIICLESSLDKNLRYECHFPPLFALSEEKLISILNQDKDNLYVFIFEKQGWQVRDIASEWTF